MELVRKLARKVWLASIIYLSCLLLIFSIVVLYLNDPQLFQSASKNWKPKEVTKEMEAGFLPQQVQYGYALVTKTYQYIGPDVANSAMRFAGNHLACTQCHLEGGSKTGASSWVGVTKRFPQFRGRSNAEGTIEDRINGCMERSMNGKKLPKDSRAMKAIVAYMNWLSEGMPKNKINDFKGFVSLQIPDRSVNIANGKKQFENRCAECHGMNGAGEKLEHANGYKYPPLWGNDTFNDGAGMHRVITAAQFIKANMPYEEASKKHPVLSDEEAFDVAGYINSLQRPAKSHKENDFPDRKLKPVSTPYGPWADDFSQQQHQFGPFPPIIKYYKETYHITKKK
ncbi:c-type cytochrome [Zhouia sp. PK063]|uniref:c-type cytochrome n=1 Tax=Zhouia sp. PK063 TaxID=3373602 RepID=UPI00379179FB